ncbi:hypothetical protein HK102_013227 [Quaeritorhiza haematococci]|nr:hypothetical protein HK102_013227 [Quaeritorhiza haematococci]
MTDKRISLIDFDLQGVGSVFRDIKPWASFLDTSRISTPSGLQLMLSGDFERGVDKLLARLEKNWSYYQGNYAALFLLMFVLVCIQSRIVLVVASLWIAGIYISSNGPDDLYELPFIPTDLIHNLRMTNLKIFVNITIAVLYLTAATPSLTGVTIVSWIFLLHSTFHKPPATARVTQAFHRMSMSIRSMVVGKGRDSTVFKPSPLK